MKAVHSLESQGYVVSLDGDKIQVRRKECFNPDAKAVKVFLQEIQANREEAVTYLRQCKKSLWCAYKGEPRWITWSACEWYREGGDPGCRGCEPFSRKQIRIPCRL